MQEATEKTVLGNFANASFTHYGVTSRFFKKDGKFFVRTDGPDGKSQEYPIAYTFGVYPLQHRGTMVKICLRGTCKAIGIVPRNGELRRCEIRLELDHNVSLEYHRYDIQLFIPVEFATLLEVGRAVTLSVEQNGD